MTQYLGAEDNFFLRKSDGRLNIYDSFIKIVIKGTSNVS